MEVIELGLVTLSMMDSSVLVLAFHTGVATHQTCHVTVSNISFIDGCLRGDVGKFEDHHPLL